MVGSRLDIGLAVAAILGPAWVAGGVTVSGFAASRPVIRWATALGTGLAILVIPVLYPPGEARLIRAILAITAITAAVRLFDLAIGAALGRRPSILEVGVFLINPFVLVERVGRALTPRLTTRGRMVQLARGLAVSGVAVAALVALFRIYPSAASAESRAAIGVFLIEHTLKVTAVFLLIYGVTEIAHVSWNAAGLPGPRIHHNFFSAASPAAFWRRYNRPVTLFFFVTFFRPSGGLRTPVRSTLLVFTISGIVHEYIVLAAIGRIEGIVFSFFVVQGVAVALTLAARPRSGWRWVVAIALTFAFNVLSSILFVAGGARVVPWWFSDAAPAWARGVGV